MKPAGPMAEARRYLAGLGLPDRDLGELPTSAKRFRDGAQYRVEIPSVEGPEPFRAVIDAAKERELRVHRISQGSGMMLLTDDEIEAMVALGVEHSVEVCLFVGPRAAWDVGVQATAPAGRVAPGRLRGADPRADGLEGRCSTPIRSLRPGLRSSWSPGRMKSWSWPRRSSAKSAWLRVPQAILPDGYHELSKRSPTSPVADGRCAGLPTSPAAR